jgi:hypothetical protein
MPQPLVSAQREPYGWGPQRALAVFDLKKKVF